MTFKAIVMRSCLSMFTVSVETCKRRLTSTVNFAGIAGVARESAPVNPGSTYSDSFTRSEYPSYPVLTPSGSSNYGQTHSTGPSRGQEPGNSAPSYGGNAGSQYPSSVPQYQAAPSYGSYSQQQSFGTEKAYPAPAQPPQPPQV